MDVLILMLLLISVIYSNSSSSNDTSYDARNDTMKLLIDIHNISTSNSANTSNDARNDDTMKSLIDIHNISTSNSANNRQDATNRRTMKTEPKYFLIGAQKAGTTSLYQLLIKAHKNICGATTKELHYFNHHYHKGTSFYDHYFTTKCNVGDGISAYIDGTPDYYKRNIVPERMNETFRLMSEKKLVLVLREPIAREFSWYEHLIRNCAKYVYRYMTSHESQIPSIGHSWDYHHLRYLCGENKDHTGNHLSGHCHQVNCMLKGKWLRLDNITRNLPSFKEYYETVKIEYENSRYIHHINNYLKYFDRKQLLILSFDMLIHDTRNAIKSILSHFQLPNTIPSNAKLPHTNEARVNAVLDCLTHYNMRKHFDSFNNQLYDYLDKRNGPLYEPAFRHFTYSKCQDYIPSSLRSMFNTSNTIPNNNETVLITSITNTSIKAIVN